MNQKEKVKEKNNIEAIEAMLSEYKYNDIPEQFIRLVNEKFDTYSYLKSLLEIKKEEASL